MKIFARLLTLMSFMLIGCSDLQTFAQEPQETNLPIAVNDSRIPPIKSLDSKNYLKMSTSELEVEIKKLEVIIELTEVDMDNFTDDDPRWDALDEYAKLLLTMEKAQTAKEKAQTAKAKERLRRACILAGSENC